jgi:hypothetical protein
MEKWKFLSQPRLELRTLSRPAHSQSLYRLRYLFSGARNRNMIVLAKSVTIIRQNDWGQQQITAGQSVKQWIGSSRTFLSWNCNWFQTTVACDQSHAIGCARGRPAVMCAWWKCLCALTTSVFLSLGSESGAFCVQLCAICAPHPIEVLFQISASRFLTQSDLRWTGPSKICVCDGTTKINNFLCEFVFFNCIVKDIATYFRFLSADWVYAQSFFLDFFHESLVGIFFTCFC